MDNEVRKGITRLLRQALDAVSQNDSFQLRELSNGNIHNTSIFQDEDSLSISVVIYALSKIIDHTNKKKSIVSHLQRALNALLAGRDEKYRSIIQGLINSIEVEDFRLRRFVSSVIEQAQVKKGCVLCEHGISVGRVASILGISKWELMNYLGKTHITEQSSEIIPTEKRLELARRLFK